MQEELEHLHKLLVIYKHNTRVAIEALEEYSILSEYPYDIENIIRILEDFSEMDGEL